MIREMQCRDIKTGAICRALYSDNYDLTTVYTDCGSIASVLTSPEFRQEFRYTKTGSSIKRAPWPDANGVKIHEGDQIAFVGGKLRLVVYDDRCARPWRIKSQPGLASDLQASLALSRFYVKSSSVKYTSEQRARGEHILSAEDFTHRTKRGG